MQKIFFDGFEMWFQIETIAALKKVNVDISVDGNIKADSDVIIILDN